MNNPKTLIIGFEPLSGDLAGHKPRAIKLNKYLEDLIKSYDLGEVHYVSKSKYAEVLHSLNPLVAITFDEFTAREVKDIKSDMALYVTDYPTTVFSRNAEVEEKKDKQSKIFKEVEYMIQRGRDEGEDGIRKFSAMSYDDMYKMIQRGIISEDKELSKKCWDVLNNSEHPNFIWMRVNLIVDCWQGADANGKYELLAHTMADYVDIGLAYEMDKFTDLEGIEYRQYEFILPDGERTKEIRRIPIPTKGMDKYGYDNLLTKYETPNGARMLLEIGQVKTKVKEYTDPESEKIYNVLKSWKEDPTKTMRELNVITKEGQMLDVPLPESGVVAFKKLLKKWNITRYEELFGEEKV